MPKYEIHILQQVALNYILQGTAEYKVVFILFFQGDQLRSRVRKICEGFRATLYQCPETATERQEMMGAVEQRIVDLESVLQTTEQHSITQLSGVAKDLEKWETKVSVVRHSVDNVL